MRHGPLRRLVLVAVAVAAAALLGPVPAAQAHAFLSSSVPADGQTLTAAPTELRLAFSEPVVLGATRVDVADGSGRHFAPTSLAVEVDTGVSGTKAPVDVVVGLQPLAGGTYQVSWETLSADDLHRTTGVIVFGVGQEVTAGGLNEPAPPPVEAGLRWLMFLGLSSALGGALAARVLGSSPGPGSARAVVLARTFSACGAIAAAAVAGILLVSQLTAGGAGAAQVLWGGYGLRWGLRELGLLLLVAAATSPRWVRGVPVRSWLLVLGGVLACAGTALLGHSGAGAATNLTRVAASAAHLGAAATWAGGVVVLALVLFGRRLVAGPGEVVARDALRRFGPPAAACVAVMVVTGVYLSSGVVGSVDAALFTIYGRALLLKLVLAGVAGALALANTLRLHRRGSRSTPRRTVVAEAVLVVGILALAAVLTSGQPAMEPQLVHRASVGTDEIVDRTVDDLQETVAVRPNQPGPNVILIDVFDTRRPAPGPVRAVQVTVTPVGQAAGAPVNAEPLADGRWSVRTTLGDPGAVGLRVVVVRAGMPATTAAYDWTVGGLPEQTRAAVVSTAPLDVVLTRAAQVLLVALLGLGLALLLARLGGPRDLLDPIRARRAARRGEQLGAAPPGPGASGGEPAPAARDHEHAAP